MWWLPTLESQQKLEAWTTNSRIGNELSISTSQVLITVHASPGRYSASKVQEMLFSLPQCRVMQRTFLNSRLVFPISISLFVCANQYSNSQTLGMLQRLQSGRHSPCQVSRCWMGRICTCQLCQSRVYRYANQCWLSVWDERGVVQPYATKERCRPQRNEGRLPLPR